DNRTISPPLLPQRGRGSGGGGATPVTPRAPGSPATSTSHLDPADPVTKLPGVGPANAARWAKLGVHTVGDAVGFFPRRFNDYTDLRTISQLTPTGQLQTFMGTVFSVNEVRRGRNVLRSEAVVTDGSGMIRLVWFRARGIKARLPEGEQFVFSGKVEQYRGRLQLSHPEFEATDAESLRAGKLVPVYAATDGLHQAAIRKAVRAAVDAVSSKLVDPVPANVLRAQSLPAMADAVRTYHYPANYREAEEARRRLALGEFLAIQAAVLTRRAHWQRSSNAPVLTLGPVLERFLASLPFSLTEPQEHALEDILADIAQSVPMLRLLQGDVGSGKTVVAFAAMLAAVVSGQQAVLMAPTEILAEQHYRTLTKMLGDAGALAGVFAPEWLGRPLRVLMLTGSLTASQKEQVRADAAHGGADIVIGTHALLEAGVQLPRLGLAVVDEQHRFGVNQREKLRQKGTNPHLLVMTATPIPRTLALTVYGDLEVSSIDSLPPGRKPIKTMWVQPHERDEAYDFLREHLDAGEQALVICPLVEESETLDARSAEEEFERLRTGPLKRYKLELLHGRMPGKEKDAIMGRFARKEADVLVSTSVIEVGIDIPNATVIVIEGAERFGLSQLHQFRGRVGRSPVQSFCMLFSTDEEPGPEATERLQAMVESTDGFRLAEVDLEMRGEGEAWGRIQSGQNTMLRVAKLTDRDILLRARDIAAAVLEDDPDLQKAEHRALAAAVKPFLEKAAEAN
ncbi:hypothetical protein AYO38_09580, partial [bacterium SCGC AG-212-C10]